MVLTFSFSQHLSPGSLVILQRPQAAASSGFHFIPPSVKSSEPILLLPPDLEAGWILGPAWDRAYLQPKPIAIAVMFSSSLGPAVEEAPLRAMLPLPSSVAPGGPLVRRAAQARTVDAGFGGWVGSRGVACGLIEIYTTPGCHSLPAGSDCSLGVKTNPVCLGQETVARRCN